MDLRLSGARAFVAGASGGLGAAVATALAAEGARVAVAARSAEKLRALADGLGGLAVPTDLSTPDGPGAAVEAAVEAFGGLDLLVVNSGGPPMGRFEDLTEADWQTAIDGTLHSALRLLRAALPHLRASDRGGDPDHPLEFGPRADPEPDDLERHPPRARRAHQVVAAEIAPVRINGIAPGRVATDRIAALDAKRAAAGGTTVEEIQRQTIARIPLGRYGEPAEIGRVAAFLLSPAASYVSAQIVGVDGGMVRSLP